MALEWNKNGAGTLEVAGHDIIPELISHALLDTAPPPPPNQGRNFRAMMKQLELKIEEDKRVAEIAAQKAVQQAIEEADEFYLPDAEQYFSDPHLRAPLMTTSESGVFSMPPELLTMIIEYCLIIDERIPEQRTTTLATLKSLRQAHSRFAYLRIIQRHLFHCLHLTPELDRLRRLDSLPQTIVSFVERVKFWPWVVKRPEIPRSSQRSIARRVQKELKPFVLRALNEDRTLKCWSSALKRLTRATSFEIVHSTSRRDTINCGPKGHFFMSLVFQSLKLSQCTINSLMIRQDITDAHVHAKVPEWQLLDFSGLRMLHLDFQWGRRSLEPSEYEEIYKAELHQVLSTLLGPVQTRLQDLRIGARCLQVFQTNGHSALPMLQRLRVDGAYDDKVDTHWLARWLTSLEKLQSLHLNRLHLHDYSLTSWKPIFDAIREHSQNLEVRLERIHLSRYAWICVRHKVPDLPGKGHRRGSNPTRAGRQATMVAEYLSKLGDWKPGDDIPYHTDAGDDQYPDRGDAEDYDPEEDWVTMLSK